MLASGVQSALNELSASLDTTTRQERLERMRAAVHALEADKLSGRLGGQK